MTLRSNCNDLTNWYTTPENSILEIDPFHFDVPGSTASVKLTARPLTPGGVKPYEAIAQYALGSPIDLTTEPILRIHLYPTRITAAVYIELMLISGDAFNQVNIGKIALNPNTFNTVDIDLRTIPAPFDITKWRGHTIRYVLSSTGETPSVNIDWIESISGLPDTHITGTVTDETTGLPIDGVDVVTGAFSTKTLTDGTYDLLVSSGTHDVTYSLIGYSPETITVDASADIVLNVALVPLPPQAVLTINVSPSGAGVTNPSEGSYSYDVGSQVPVSATVAGGYEFSHWLLDDVPAGMQMPITVNLAESRDYTLTAVFIELPPTPTHQLSIDSIQDSTPIVVPLAVEKVG